MKKIAFALIFLLLMQGTVFAEKDADENPVSAEARSELFDKVLTAYDQRLHTEESEVPELDEQTDAAAAEQII